MRLRVKTKDGYNYFPYRELVVNNSLFRFSGKTAGVRYYESVGSPSIPSIFCIEGKPDQPLLDGFVNHRIEARNKEFIRRMENFFTPNHPTEKDIIDFFNLIALRYDNLIDKDLNRQIIKRIFDMIHKRDGMLSNLPPEKEVKVLDYGVGTGLSFEVHKGREFLLSGCDVSNKMISVCQKKQITDVELCKYSRRIPYESEFFNVGFAVFVVHYFIDEKPYKEIFRVLKPKGVFVCNIRTPSEPETYKQALYRIGFENVKLQSWSIDTSEKSRDISVVLAQKR